jgi:hypothetical protein
MHFKLLAAAGVAAAVLLWPSQAAAAACCEQASVPCCEKAMPCCDQPGHSPDVSAIDMLLAMDPQINPAPPVRQTTEVWLMRPTWVGRSILQGRYVIEHDNDRMARGEPCTHIYAFDDRETPVATFHCTHLERDRASQNQVVLITMSDGLQKLTEFQFAGESASHGYPAGR